MRTLLVATALTMLAAIPAHAQSIEVRPNGAAPSTSGTPETFAGNAVITPLFPANETTRANTGLVNFAPGSRTAWHTHPAGQLLIVTSGQGWVQEEGQGRRVINPGDVVWIPANIKHWHGATNASPMAHIALTYMVEGKNVVWLEQVTDEQYRPR